MTVSVSIALLPVALAMRIVMGKDNFENWVRSQQIRVPTTFRNEAELCRAVKKAGYDAVRFGSSMKTHIDGEKLFFFWEFVDGKWVALFSRHDDSQMLERFMDDVELAAGSTVFSRRRNPTEPSQVRFPTNFREGAMLMSALKDFGATPKQRTDGSIICKVGESELLFVREGESPFMVEVKNGPELEQVYRYMSDIDDDYKRCVQTAVYEKIKARAAEKDLVVDHEEVLQDKTIVLTLRVR